MIQLFKKIFCKHDYTYTYLYKTDGGMSKVYRVKCKKCGKECIKVL